MVQTSDDATTHNNDNGRNTSGYRTSYTSSRASTTSSTKEDLAIRKAAEKEEGQDNYDDFELEEDIFSLWLVSGIKSCSFWYCFAVFFTQVTILVLLNGDVLRDEDRPEWEKDDNIINIPLEVHWTVSFSQFLALIIAAVSQDDVLKSIDAVISVKYDPILIQEAGVPNVTLFRWRLFNSLRWVEGMMTLLVTLVIVLQSDKILDIFMNFAAVEFVSNIDNLAFEFASTGFLGHAMKIKTDRVKKISFPRDRSNCKLRAIQTVFVFNLLSLLGIWAWVQLRQNTGYYLQNESCNSVIVEFGNEIYDISTIMSESDKFPPLIYYSYFSGEYIAVKDRNNRPVYYERGEQNDKRAGKFYYCDTVQSWVFTIPALLHAIPEKDGDENRNGGNTGLSCPEGWLLQSPMTEAFMLEDAPSANWNIIVGDGIVGTTQDLHLSCGECSRDADCSLNGHCNNDGQCECTDGWQGRICNLEKPVCDKLTWINSGESSYTYWSYSPFELMAKKDGSDLNIYERPVYKSQFTDGDFCPGNTEYYVVILYTGRRWLASANCDIEMFQSGKFHTYWSNYIQDAMLWYSDPTDKKTPTGFPWYQIRATRARGNIGLFGFADKLNARFECMAISCNPNNLAVATCGDLGRCSYKTDGSNATKCLCERLSSGYFCEYPQDSTYVSDQAQVILATLENSTNYNEFTALLELGGGKNAYYQEYFDHQIVEYFATGRMGTSHNDSWVYEAAANFHGLTRRILSETGYSSSSAVVGSRRLPFRL